MNPFKNWHSETSAAPLAVYRICFGLLMLFSTVRFISKGWVTSLYIEPKFHFSYQGFDWLPYPSEFGIWTLFILLIITSLFITLGFLYRFSTILFFLSFSFVELLDKANYLNHYYFVSLVAFLLIFISSHRMFSLDRFFGLVKSSTQARLWEIRILQFQISVVYFFAGIAKIEADWLLNAQPLKYWLHTANHISFFGDLLKQDWVAYLFSWVGCIYDLTIVLFLVMQKTRKAAYFAVITFHLTTWLLFPIGVFPWVMMAATTIFFSIQFHEQLLQFLSRFLRRTKLNNESKNGYFNKTMINVFLITFISFQILTPLRFILYEGDLFWTENGYRFSWRVMLMEKTATSNFYVIDNSTNTELEVNNADFLTKNQEKMMAAQPDMILQYSQFLKNEFTDTIINRFGHELNVSTPEIQAEIFVTLNGRPHQEYVSKGIDLSTITMNENPYNWLEKFND